MRQAAVTLPTVTILIDLGHRFLVAAATVFLQQDSPRFGELNGLRDSTRIENKSIPHACISLPGKMSRYVVIGKMTVDAFQAAMPPIMKPVLIFGFHDMTLSAELGSVRFGKESRRSEAHIRTDDRKHQNHQSCDPQQPGPVAK